MDRQVYDYADNLRCAVSDFRSFVEQHQRTDQDTMLALDGIAAALIDIEGDGISSIEAIIDYCDRAQADKLRLKINRKFDHEYYLKRHIKETHALMFPQDM